MGSYTQPNMLDANHHLNIKILFNLPALQSMAISNRKFELYKTMTMTLNYAMQKLRGQTVTLMNLLQFVIAGVAGYLMYNEVPSKLFYLASSFIVAGLLIAILSPRKKDTA